MLRNAINSLIRHHYAIYQAFLGLVAVVAALHILFLCPWGLAIGHGVVTLSAFFVGQVLVDLTNNKFSRRSRRTLD